MSALPDDTVTEFFKNANGVLVADPGSLGISNEDFSLAHFE
jgi:hypothetical protein